MEGLVMEDKNNYKSFTELVVWQEARVLKNQIKKLVERLPKEEKFRLGDQLVRSSRSVTSCISEGHGRYAYKDQLHFCIQSRGSLSGTHNHLIDAVDCEYIDETTFKLHLDQVNKVEQLLNGYITYLRGKI